jgi:hypothetical protein
MTLAFVPFPSLRHPPPSKRRASTGSAPGLPSRCSRPGTIGRHLDISPGQSSRSCCLPFSSSPGSMSLSPILLSLLSLHPLAPLIRSSLASFILPQSRRRLCFPLHICWKLPLPDYAPSWTLLTTRARRKKGERTRRERESSSTTPAGCSV